MCARMMIGQALRAFASKATSGKFTLNKVPVLRMRQHVRSQTSWGVALIETQLTLVFQSSLPNGFVVDPFDMSLETLFTGCPKITTITRDWFLLRMGSNMNPELRNL